MASMFRLQTDRLKGECSAQTQWMQIRTKHNHKHNEHSSRGRGRQKWMNEWTEITNVCAAYASEVQHSHSHIVA